MPVIKLQSSDGEVFEVDVEIAKASNTIKTMIEGMCVALTRGSLLYTPWNLQLALSQALHFDLCYVGGGPGSRVNLSYSKG